MNRPWWLVSAAVPAAIVVAIVGLVFGAWWLTFPAAIAVGAVTPRTWFAVAAGAIVGLASWGAVMIAQSIVYGLNGPSLALAAILGVSGAAIVPITLTLLVGVLLGLSGAWLGAAAGGLVLNGKGSGPVQKLGDERLEVKDAVLTKS